MPLLISLGADKVFVTLRDNADWQKGCNPLLGKLRGKLSSFCLEGLVTLKRSEPNYDRPSMCVFQEAK
jgi:hypothetical protein